MPQEKIHIAMISEATSGGTRKHIVDLLEGIDKNKFRLTFIFSKDRADSILKNKLDTLSASGIELIELQMKREINPLNDLLCLIRLSRILKKLKPDIIHLHASKAFVLGSLASRLLGIRKVIVNPHGGIFHRIFGLKGHFFLFVQRLLTFKYIHFVGVSNYAIQLFNKYLRTNPDQFHLIYNGVVPIDNMIRYVSANDKFTALWPALFYSEKGHINFIDAVIAAGGLNSKTEIILAGNGPLGETIRHKVEQSNLNKSFLFHGFEYNIDKLIDKSDIVILPSKYEFMPYAILESLARNKPVLATRVGGIPELIDDGINGELFEFNELETLVNRLNDFAKDKTGLQKYGANGKQMINSKFRLMEMISKTEELYCIVNKLY